MEAQRKEEAKQAVAAVEAAEKAAVLEAFSQIFNSAGSGNRSDTPPGVLGEALIQTDIGPIKVAGLSVQALATTGGVANISAGQDSSAEVEVHAGAVGPLHSRPS